ncbi:hypothetical protein DOY81_007172 [Sarcophaga bullata]|nr:hypothetical protein DOY81_007172 [Sarcophaga bullata]
MEKNEKEISKKETNLNKSNKSQYILHSKPNNQNQKLYLRI